MTNTSCLRRLRLGDERRHEESKREGKPRTLIIMLRPPPCAD
jgi:hypothetical protein